MNISIPEDMKRRMEKTGADVNWSAIARKAFQLKLGEIAARKRKKTTADVVDRLRATLIKDEIGAIRLTTAAFKDANAGT